jgi:hypothetical protein
LTQYTIDPNRRISPRLLLLVPRASLEGIAMHDHQFDIVVRALAERVPRRAATRGLIAAFATALAVMREAQAVAYRATTPLGGPCYQTNQCLHHAVVTRRVRTRSSPQAVYCADNGFRYDGDLNCCRYRGGSCQRDEHCCGFRYFCRNKTCTYLA